MDLLPRCLGSIVVINLPARADRRAEMSEQLGRFGLGWDSPRVTRFAAPRPTHAEGFRTLGAHGCFLSHLGAIESALERGAQALLILEDDCNFSADLNTRLPALASALDSSDWSIFYGGHAVSGEPPAPLRSGVPLAAVPAEQAIVLAHCVAFRGHALRTLPAYLRAMLARPAGHPEGGPMDVDGAYSWFRRAHPQYRTLIATPAMAYQRASRTDISTLSWRDRMPLVREVVGAGRRVLNLIER